MTNEPADLLAVVDLLTKPRFEHVAQQLEDGRVAVALIEAGKIREAVE